jgi:hypothetical protein
MSILVTGGTGVFGRTFVLDLMLLARRCGRFQAAGKIAG